MYPILYSSDETDFTHNGLGILRDSTSAVVTEEDNGIFELHLGYDQDGQFADIIDYEMIIKAKANDKQEPQLFRIYAINKSLENGNLVIDAQHVTYDLAGNFVEALVLENATAAQAMATIQNNLSYPTRFTISSDNTTTKSSTKLYRTNPLQMIGGIDGSILDNWGGEIERDNFRLILHARRGSDDGVLVAYRKNLTGLEAKFDVSNVVTRIFPFKTMDDGTVITIPNKYIDSPNINAYSFIRILPVDYSQDEDVTDQASIQAKASTYFNSGGHDRPTVTMDVTFESLWKTEEYKDVASLELVGMGDTITIHHKKMNVDTTAKVVKIEYDVISEKNAKVTVGNVRAGMTNKVNSSSNNLETSINQALSAANQAMIAANGKNTNYYGPDEPAGVQKDDIWFKVVDGDLTRIYRFDGIQWQLIVDADTSAVQQAAQEAQEAADNAQKAADAAKQTADSAVQIGDAAQQAANNATQLGDAAQQAANSASQAANQAQINAANAATQANDAVDKATQATNDAQMAITNAQSAFDDAQSAVSTATSALTKAQDSFNAVDALSAVVDTQTGDISTLKQTAQGLQTQVTDNANDISTVSQTASALQSRMTSAEGNISTLQQTSSSLTSRISTAEGNISSLTQTAAGLQTQVNNKAESSTVTQLAGVVDSKVTSSQVNSLIASDKQIKDTRSTNEKPSYYFTTYPKSSVREFKTLSVLGVSTDGTYGVLETDVPWVDKSGGQIKQTLYTDKSTYERKGDGNTDTWSAWKKVADTDYVSSQINQTSSSITQTITDTKNNLQSQINSLSDNINLRVSKNDVINQINVSIEGILIDGNKVHITGQTIIDNAVIKDAMIASLTASKLTVGTIDASVITVKNLNASNLTSGAISANLFAAKSIDASKLVAGTLTSASGVFGDINASSITSGYLNVARIQAGSLDASVLKAGSITAASEVIGSIDASKITSGTLSAITITGSNITSSSNSTNYVNLNGGNLTVYAKGASVDDGGFYDSNGAYITALINPTTFSRTVSPVTTSPTYNVMYKYEITPTKLNIYASRQNFGHSSGVQIDVSPAVATIKAHPSPGPNSLSQIKLDDVADISFSNGSDIGAVNNDLNLVATSNIINLASGPYINTSGGIARIQYDASNYVYIGSGVVSHYIGTRSIDFKQGDTVGHMFIEGGLSGIQLLGTSSAGIQARNSGNSAYAPMYATAFTVASTRDIKKNIAPFTDDAIAIINSSIIQTYQYTNEVDGELPHIGLIYDEAPVQVVDPSGIGIDQYAMISISWRAIQEISQQNENLILKIANLETRIAQLEAT